MVTYPSSNIPAPTPNFHGSHTIYPNALLFPTRPPPSQSTQQLHQPPSSLRCGPSTHPSPPPPRHGSSDGVVPSSPPRLSRFEKDTTAIQHQAREVMRMTWLCTDQEKEMQSVESMIERTTVTLGNGNDTFAAAGEESIQSPKQRRRLRKYPDGCSRYGSLCSSCN